MKLGQEEIQDDKGEEDQKYDVMSSDDIWLMRDADDFLRYLKFEAITYGYYMGHMFMSMYLLTRFITTNETLMNAFLMIMIVWRVSDIVEMHIIEAYNFNPKLLIVKNVIQIVSLIIVAVLYSVNFDALYTNHEISSSRWVLVELLCGIVFQPLWTYNVFSNVKEAKEETSDTKELNPNQEPLMSSVKKGLKTKIFGKKEIQTML